MALPPCRSSSSSAAPRHSLQPLMAPPALQRAGTSVDGFYEGTERSGLGWRQRCLGLRSAVELARAEKEQEEEEEEESCFVFSSSSSPCSHPG